MEERRDGAEEIPDAGEPGGEPGSGLSGFDVHLYCLVRVKVCGIIADNSLQAIDIAEERIRPDRLFARLDILLPPQMEAEYADEILGYLVDEGGDEQYERTGYFCRHKRPIIMSEEECRCERPSDAQSGLRPLREILDRLGFKQPGSRLKQALRHCKHAPHRERRYQTSRRQPK